MRQPLPFMKTLSDAQALCDKEKDPFYLDAFMIEAWLGHIVLEAAEEYSEKKNAKDRAMQTGQSWRGFLHLFGHAKDQEFYHVLQSLYRFTDYDDVQAHLLIRAIIPLSVEQECFGDDFTGPKAPDAKKQFEELVGLMRRKVERWCGWIDAVVHFQTHASWHLLPVQFDPDGEKRELAALGINQRQFAELGDFGKTWWQWHHGEAAERFKDSPKWTMVGQAMASRQERTWSYPELDTDVISLWPLVTRQNWTYRDLLNVINEFNAGAKRYPCQREQDFAAYCSNVLGLRKRTSGKTSRNGKPKGYDVAVRICHLNRESS